MQFIQIRHSGEVYHHTVELAKRDDIDVIEAPEGSTTETVLAALNEAKDKLAAEAAKAAAEAEKEHAVAVAAHTRKVHKISKVPPAAVTVARAGTDGDGSGE